MKIRLVSLGMLLISIAGLAGCGGDAARRVSGSSGMGHVRLLLTDAPSPYEAINLVVREVSIHRAGNDAGWEVIQSGTATYDLLQLRNGLFATLGVAPVPAGHYTQIRLKLDPGSNVVVGGITYPLFIPSGEQSGYKLVGEFDVPADDSVEVLLDLDGARSIHQTGNGRYMLRPTARIAIVEFTGSIAGAIAPAGASATVYALMAQDTVTNAVPAADGHFVLPALLPGIYSVAVHPDAGFRDTTLAGVTVRSGMTTSVGVIELTAQ